ncbi:hypothetical protein [Burkholderia vietnamiensis]|nr:hypothetical protein [Burkholderia vietnamiensis]MDN8071540.1 hypothetical protein [Burkholderia vietnamiensis]
MSGLVETPVANVNDYVFAAKALLVRFVWIVPQTLPALGLRRGEDAMVR